MFRELKKSNSLNIKKKVKKPNILNLNDNPNFIKENLQEKISKNSSSLKFFKFKFSKNIFGDFFKKKNLDLIKTKKVIKPSYYMKSLNFNFKIKNDNLFSILYKDHFHQMWIDLKFTSKTIKISNKILESKKIIIKKAEEKKTLILDLDETLISCIKNGKTKIEFTYKKKIIKAFINIRPYLKEFLEFASKKFELILFSNSHICYINAILKIIDPKRKYFKFVLSKKNSIKFENVRIKYLKILNRDLKKVLIVDDNSLLFCKNLDNAIPILPFFDNKEDMELLMLETYLNYIDLFDDVRKINKQFFKLYRYKKFDDLNGLFKSLFE